jgi:hypothetical protein
MFPKQTANDMRLSGFSIWRHNHHSLVTVASSEVSPYEGEGHKKGVMSGEGGLTQVDAKRNQSFRAQTWTTQGMTLKTQ